MTETSYLMGEWLFLKGVALSYFFAFVSLREQMLGLYGSRGIQPIHDLLYGLGQSKTLKRLFYIPTLFWWRSDDSFLQGMATVGCALSLLAFFNLAVFPSFVLLWILYLSFMSVGSPFLHFQWDTLLLETGFAALFVSLVAPAPTFIHLWLLFLVFRFLLASGLVKIISHCKEWGSLHAMACHFETQPLPNRGGFFAHLFFKSLTKIVTLFVYFFEIIVPFLFFGTDAMQAIGGVLSLFFQLLIIVTGNFAYFNLLTIALSFPLFSDAYLSWLQPLYVSSAFLPSNLLLSLILNGVGILMLLFNGIAFARQFMYISFLPDWFQHLDRFYIVNTYGLFARMTAIRNEVILEGSDDGVEWKEYQFKYKPGALNAPPLQIAPFHPRLDWQMWFAALTTKPHESWWNGFMMRLLQGSKEVQGLLKENPFPHQPPVYLRAHLFRYRFNTFTDWKKTGNYWVRTYVGTYMKPISLH